MASIFEEAVKTIYPEFNDLTFIEVHRLIEAVAHKEQSIMSLIKCSYAKEKVLFPILSYGFEPLQDLMGVYDDEILGMVEYLLLPTTLAEIQVVFSEQKRPSKLDDKKAAFQAFAIRQVREFRHRFDNHWMVLSLHANRAKKEVPALDSKIPSSLASFNMRMVQERFDEYENIRVYVEHLALPGRKRILKIFETVKKELASISDCDVQQAVSIAFSCVSNFKEISEYLAKAKEIDT